MKTVAFCIALMISFSIYGQKSIHDDTIFIKEVLIRGPQKVTEEAGFRKTKFDSALINDFNHKTLADLLSAYSSLYVKTYGAGGIATPAFRGTGAGHTQITWNNININSPMLGQFDMSLVPAGFIDDVDIYYGGGSIDLASGGFGGIINLETKPDWTGKNSVLVNPGAGSYGRYSGLIKAKAGSSSFQSVTKAFIRSAENNFKYLNMVKREEPIWEKRENAQVIQKGFMQELYYKGVQNVLSAKLWYQSSDRNLPEPITTSTLNPPEKQNDESFRTLINFETSKRNTNYNITAAYLSDKLLYTNKQASIDSRNNSRTLTLNSVINTKVNNRTKIKINLSNELNIINSINYQGIKRRNIASASASAETDLTRWLVTRLLVRETLQDSKVLVPDFSASSELKLFSTKEYFLKANISKNSKIPSINDMYWLPGGNPELKNENGYTAEAGWEMSENISEVFKLKGELTYFINFINNMIQWHAGDLTYWQADNLKKIKTSGIESDLSLIYTADDFNFGFDAGYSYTKAETVGSSAESNLSGCQLIYVPKSQLNTSVRLKWKKVYSSFTAKYTGKRFITSDNTQYLPEYTVCDLNLGANLKSLKTIYDLRFSVENLFNINYQNIAWYPMPGRAYYLSLIFQFKM